MELVSVRNGRNERKMGKEAKFWREGLYSPASTVSLWYVHSVFSGHLSRSVGL